MYVLFPRAETNLLLILVLNVNVASIANQIKVCFSEVGNILFVPVFVEASAWVRKQRPTGT